MVTFGDSFAIATGFQKEGMVLVDLAAKIAPDTGRPRPRVFTLDTGRLPRETYEMMDTVRQRYGVAVEVVFPEREAVERMVAERGANLFYNSVEGRALCCRIRKVEPLERKLKELRAWATGLRRAQSDTRSAVAKIEEAEGRIKVNPLADWSTEQLEEHIRANGVPVHPLYARGYASIGCDPCTRAIMPGEGARAGRWWWEQNSHKECGIHFNPDGSVRRDKVAAEDAA